MEKAKPESTIQEQPLSRCARKNLEKYNAFSEKMLEKTFMLPCGCEEATMISLLNSHPCSICKTKYIYSFCLDEVVSEESTWHCEVCGSC